MKLQQDKYSLLVSDGELIIQRADYIEDGWYVVALEGGYFEVREIVQYGGGERCVSNHSTLLSAIEAGEALT